MQKFKNDDDENNVIESGLPALDATSFQLSEFFAGAYDTYPLGDMIYESKRAPLTNAIIQSIFRQSFNEIFTAFTVAGSFESYLSVFRKIFGDDVTVEFTVPGPGLLNIDIEAEGVEFSNFVARTIVDNAYVFDQIVDEVDDNIVFQTVKGFQTQYELEQMLFEMVPTGIYTEITLTLGA